MFCPRCKATMRYKVRCGKAEPESYKDYIKIYDCPECFYRKELTMTPAAFAKYINKKNFGNFSYGKKTEEPKSRPL